MATRRIRRKKIRKTRRQKGGWIWKALGQELTNEQALSSLEENTTYPDVDKEIEELYSELLPIYKGLGNKINKEWVNPFNIAQTKDKFRLLLQLRNELRALLPDLETRYSDIDISSGMKYIRIVMSSHS
jgi:hypothetical protein